MSRYSEILKERDGLIERLKQVSEQLKQMDSMRKVKTIPSGNYLSELNKKIKSRIEVDRWKIISLRMGIDVKNQNQYDLACMGASQEIIDSDVPAEVYELILRHGK